MQSLQKLDFTSGWKGLLSRRHDLDLDPMWAGVARNVEFWQGAPAKREGSQYVNGWGVCDRILYDRALTYLDQYRDMPTLLVVAGCDTHAPAGRRG